MDMDTTASRSRSLPIIKAKQPSISGNVGLGRTFFLSAKVCTSCVQPLGLFLSRGSNCPKCGLKVCKKCKVYRDNFTSWTCLVCSKELPNHVKSITIGGKSKKYRNDPSYSNIKRSWSISATNRGSPILKAYTKYNGEENNRGYSSLPRMTTSSTGQGYNNGQGQSDFYDGGHQYAHTKTNSANTTTTVLLNVLEPPFQSTLHPYMTNQGQRSPSSSINFIEDEYWDYYDYEINNSNRSSCERSLGESVEYKYQHDPQHPHPTMSMSTTPPCQQQPPKKPIRTKKRSRSVGSYDAINPKYSQLKTYCIVDINTLDNNNVTPPAFLSFGKKNPTYSSLPLRKSRSSSEGKENIIKIEKDLTTPPSSSRLAEKQQPIRMKKEEVQNYASQSLPRRIRNIENNNNTEIRRPYNNTSNTLPKEWKILKRRNNGATTIVITGVNSPPNPTSAISPFVYTSTKSPRSHTHLSRTYISSTGDDDSYKKKDAMVNTQLTPRKFPIKEPYPFFPKQIQPFPGVGVRQQRKEMRPLLPIYHGVDNSHGIFKLAPPVIEDASAAEISPNLSSSAKFLSVTLRGDNNDPPPPQRPSSSSSGSSCTLIGETNNNNSREVIIEIQREEEDKRVINDNKNSVNKNKTEESSVPIPEEGVESLRSLSSILKRIPIENKGIMGQSESRGDLIDTSGGGGGNRGNESDSSLSDSSFYSLTNLHNNGMMDSTGVKKFRGEDKDEFLSCNVSSEEEDDDDDVDERGVVVVRRATGSSSEESKLLPVPKNTPENQKNQYLGLSDQRVEGNKTSASDDDDENDDGIEFIRSGGGGTTTGTDEEVRSMSTFNNQVNNNIRKYKSRVLIGTDEDQTVEISGQGEVEILIGGSGTSTFVKDFNICDGDGAGAEKENNFNGISSSSSPLFKSALKTSSEIDTPSPSSFGKTIYLPEVKVSTGATIGGENISQSSENANNEYKNNEPISKLPVNDIEKKVSVVPGPLLENSYFRESPEGEEAASSEEKKSEAANVNVNTEQKNQIPVVPAPSRSSPDGADADKSDASSTSTPTTTPILEMNSEDECKSESTDSWTEEVTFVEDVDDRPAPLDMTLHTICEESETESEHSKRTPTNFTTETTHGLEKYFNFTSTEDGILGAGGDRDNRNYEESEFSDTFSESSFNSELRNSVDFSQLLDMDEGDPVELASGRLEKYFLNLGVALSNDSDSVGSESESGSSVLENKKKVLKHHRRSAEFEDEHNEISEDDDCAFEQDGFDTIKKQRKLKKSQEDLLKKDSSNPMDFLPPPPPYPFPAIPYIPPSVANTGAISPKPLSEPSMPSPSSSMRSQVEVESKMKSRMNQPSVSRSNSFNWSSDEEVNLMMRSLRQLIKNMTLSKKKPEEEEEGRKGEKLMYLENELIRLMKNEQNMKNIVEHMSSDSDEDVYKFFEKADNQPELLSKVMTHIGERLNTWMKDEDEDNATIKCGQSVSSDLNDDESDTRFSWKGSFESTLAKRQSVGSSDSLDCGPIPNDGTELFSDRSILRSSSLHHLANSQPILEECESSLTSSLTRLHHPSNTTGNPSSGGGGSQSITKSKSLFLDPHREVKSARYRPPGYFETKVMSNDTHSSTPVLTHRNSDEGEKENSKGFSIRGQIEFSMQYNYKNSNFEVSIKQCRDLAAVDAKKGRSDPYVKGYLLPDRTKSNKKKTKTKKNTLNPVFGETLKFHISLEEIESRTLWLSVWHSDMFGKNEFLGQVTIPLKGLTFDDSNYTWYTLKEEEVLKPANLEETTKINLILALKWTSTGFNRDRGNLSVLIKEAKGLKLIKNSLPSTFIKCSPLNDRTKKQKTPLARRTTTPIWNTTMNFESVTSEGLEVSLYNSDLLNHEQIGIVKLDCDSELWRNMGKREGFWVEASIQLTTI